MLTSSDFALRIAPWWVGFEPVPPSGLVSDSLLMCINSWYARQDSNL